MLILTIWYKSWCFSYIFIPISSLSTSKKKEDISFRWVYFLLFFSFSFHIDLILSYISHLLRFSVFTINWLHKKVHVFFITFFASSYRSLKKCHIKHTDVKLTRMTERWNSPSIFSTLLDDFPGWCLQLPLSPLPLLLFIIFDFLSFSPINTYSTVMRTIGTTKKKNVDNSNECLTRTLFTVHITIFGLLWWWTTPTCNASGNANNRPINQITRISFTALVSFDIVCDKNGWQIAKYLSTVNAVMVSTEAFVEVSAARPRRTQKTSPNMYGYLNQTI